MKNNFIGFYNPTEEEINDSWSNGIFAFDANSILNLYRYTELTRNDFISALNSIKAKLYFPYQAAYEFHKNRLKVIDALDDSYDEVMKILGDNFKKTIEPQINQFKKHPSIIIREIYNLHSTFIDKVSKELEKQKKKHPNFKSNDLVLDKITELFKNKIGTEFSKDVLKKIYLEGKERYSERIPPGYKDADKSDKLERNVYGDLIIWKELIAHAQKEKKPIIFITDDRKEDWWTIENGKTIRPREELIKEFYDATSIRLLIYNAENFLLVAKERGLIPQINQKTIDEVKEIRISDEKTYLNNFYLGSIPIKMYDKTNLGINVRYKEILENREEFNRLLKSSDKLDELENYIQLREKIERLLHVENLSKYLNENKGSKKHGNDDDDDNGDNEDDNNDVLVPV